MTSGIDEASRHWPTPTIPIGIYLAGPMGNRRQIDAIGKLLPVRVVSTWHAADPPELPSPALMRGEVGMLLVKDLRRGQLSLLSEPVRSGWEGAK